jgi:hypothetical protein
MRRTAKSTVEATHGGTVVARPRAHDLPRLTDVMIGLKFVLGDED